MSSSAARLIALVVALGLAAAALVGSAGPAAAAADCQFVMGFKALHAMIPDTVGVCVENEQHHPGQGVTHQRTTHGLLVWRKASNHTAFTDGHHTWVSGPLGLQQRLNSEWFDWERDSAPAAFTQAYVAQAIAMYDEQGREATFEYYSRPESAEGRWYLFIIDLAVDGLVLHPNPGLLGAKTATRRDPRGYAYGIEMLKATEAGHWVSYYYRTYDGETAVEEGQKHTWLVRHDGLLFASGWYDNVVPLPNKEDDPAGYTRWFVQDAVDIYDTRGLEALIEWTNDPTNVDGDWYIYVLDLEGTIIAHILPELRGQSLLGPVGVDITGARFGPDFLKITEEGGWITYYSRNPNGADCELKHSWAVRRREVIIGSGWYEDAVPQPPLPSKCEVTDYTVATVEQAVAATARKAARRPSRITARWRAWTGAGTSSSSRQRPAPYSRTRPTSTSART